MQNIEHYSIRTSDRRVFRRCLRKWAFQSSLRNNLTRIGDEQNPNFWFGSGIHFALEDYHSYRRFETPMHAFKAYAGAFKDLNFDVEEYLDMGYSMLNYYMSWYKRHNDFYQFETALVDKEGNLINPRQTEKTSDLDYAVEQSFMLPLNVYTCPTIQGARGICTEKKNGWVPVYYHGTMDRIVCDSMGRFWILDYKTAKGADTNKLDTDDQIAAYLWAFEKQYKIKPYGFIYLQLTKTIIRQPKTLTNGELSTDKKQNTTHALYKEALLERYETVNAAPNKYIDFLNYLAEQETEEGDKFIRWDFIRRTPEQIAYTERNIMGELQSMLNPDLYCYPNPTRDCIWDCPCREWCLMLEREDEVGIKNFLIDYEQRPREDGNLDPWREKIQYPENTEAPQTTIGTGTSVVGLEGEAVCSAMMGEQKAYELGGTPEFEFKKDIKVYKEDGRFYLGE